MNMHKERSGTLVCNGVTWEVYCICGQVFHGPRRPAVEEVLRLHVTSQNAAWAELAKEGP